MPNGEHITKKQHYIPQTFLKGFSADGKTICRYDIVNKKSQNNIPIKSIATDEYLYEFKDLDGQIYDSNHIEKILSKIESQFAKYKKRLEDSVKCEQNYHSKCFLNTEEKRFWKCYILLQMVRHAESIKLVTDDYLENCGFNSEIVAKNAVLCSFLPFFEKFSSVTYQEVPLLTLYDNAAFIVRYDETGLLFTNDKTGCFISKGKMYDGMKKWKFVLFPITSHILIEMHNMDVAENQQFKDYRNSLLPFDQETLLRVRQSIANYADKMILSPYPLSNDDIDMIEEMQKNRYRKEGRNAIF